MRTLPEREREVAELLLLGHSNVEISHALKMSPRTVNSHLNRLFLRCGITSGKRTELAAALLSLTFRASFAELAKP